MVSKDEMSDQACETPLVDRLRRLHPSDVFNYERFSDEGGLIQCGQVPIGLDSHCAADLIEQQRLSVDALAWLQSLTDDGHDVTISRMHEHAGFGFANKLCVSIRKAYGTPRRLYGDSLEAIYYMTTPQRASDG
jgi:hypothetical protein